MRGCVAKVRTDDDDNLSLLDRNLLFYHTSTGSTRYGNTVPFSILPVVSNSILVIRTVCM